VLKAFIAEGVDIIFGYPGGAIMPIYDALYDYQDRLQHILSATNREAYTLPRDMQGLREKLASSSQQAAPVPLTW
jgi:glyoxylate carboligase